MTGPGKLLEYQRERRSKIIELLAEAKTTIEKEIDELGYYPRNQGKLTAKELVSRAGIGYSTLKNPTHKSTAASVKKWVKRMKLKLQTSNRQEPGQSEGSSLERELTLLTRKFDLFKLQYDEIEARCDALEHDNSLLRDENAALRAEKVKVVSLDGRRPAL
jgi:hypothetical protein